MCVITRVERLSLYVPSSGVGAGRVLHRLATQQGKRASLFSPCEECFTDIFSKYGNLIACRNLSCDILA